MCSSWSNIKKSPRWPLHPTYGKEVIGQKRSKNGVKFWTILNGKTNTAKVLVGVKHQKVSTVTSSPDLWLRGQRSKNVKLQTTWNDKSNTVNVLILVKHQKKFTVTFSSDLRKRGQRSKKVKSQTTSNDKISTVNVFIFAKHQKNVYGDLFVWPTVEGAGIGHTWKVSVITPLSEQLSRVQRCRSKVA